MNEQGLYYIFIEPDNTINGYYKDDGIIDIGFFAKSLSFNEENFQEISRLILEAEVI